MIDNAEGPVYTEAEFAAAVKDAWDKGYDEGYDEGYEEGRGEGEQE